MRGGLRDDWGGEMRVLEHGWKIDKPEFSSWNKCESSKQEKVSTSDKLILYNSEKKHLLETHLITMCHNHICNHICNHIITRAVILLSRLLLLFFANWSSLLVLCTEPSTHKCLFLGEADFYKLCLKRCFPALNLFFHTDKSLWSGIPVSIPDRLWLLQCQSFPYLWRFSVWIPLFKNHWWE